jgi:hypothetical protein
VSITFAGCQVRAAQHQVGAAGVGLKLEHALEIFDGRLHRAGLDVQLGEENRRVDRAGSRVQHLAELVLRLLGVPRSQVGDGELVVRGRHPRLGLEHHLELLDGAGRVILGQVDPTAEEVAVDVGGALLQHHVERLDRVGELPLGEVQLRQ